MTAHGFVRYDLGYVLLYTDRTQGCDVDTGYASTRILKTLSGTIGEIMATIRAYRDAEADMRSQLSFYRP